MPKPKAAQPAPQHSAGRKTLYTLEVRLIDGMVTESFVDKNPTVSRTIQILGNHTLEDLHGAIFGAFDRYDEHLYEFQVGGKKPHDRKALRYGDALLDDGAFDEPGLAGIAGATRMDALNLKPRAVFYYWFDFGDDWMHRIKVASIEEGAPAEPLPRVIERVGASPPQYPNNEEDDDLDDEDLDDEEKTKA
jgi:hypothetical protein